MLHRRTTEYRTSWDARLGRLFYTAKTRAARQGVPFTITRPYILGLVVGQRYLCARTGMALTLDTGGLGAANPWGPSIERNIPALGYQPDNIEIVCVMYNLAKNTATNEDVVAMARALIAFEDDK